MSLLSSGLKKLGSNLKSIGDIATRAAPVIAGGLVGGPIGVITTGLGVISKIAPSTSPLKVPAPSALPVPISGGGYPGTAAYSPSAAGGGVLAPIISGAVSGLIDRYAPGGGGGTAVAGCGCGSSRGRDPCTHQVYGSRNTRAPKATFFGGCCPPGRTLRRLGGGARDICIKTPRMNVFNPRALARADRRITGFARRTAPILRDMGYDVSRHRKVKVKLGRGRRRARR